MDIKVHKDKKLANPKETFCHECGQLRLNLIGALSCGNCGSDMIDVGEPGTLKR